MSIKNQGENNRSCKTCIHIQSAHFRKDGLCMPQVFSSKNPRSVYKNIACRFYEEAPKEHILNGPFGVKIREIWDSKYGYYVLAKNPTNIEVLERTQEENVLMERYEKGDIKLSDYIISGIKFD